MRALILSLVVVVLGGIGSSSGNAAEIDQLLAVDHEFSEMSQTGGIAKAFDYYQADSATILRNRMLPVTGRTAINALFADAAENEQLIWEPFFAAIAASGDLGYTFGQWTYTIPDSAGVLQVTKGHYITIWEKQEGGEWKYVFDTGTTGLPDGSK